MAISDYKRFVVPGALVVGGLTAGSMLMPVGLVSADEDSSQPSSDTTDQPGPASAEFGSDSDSDGDGFDGRRVHSHPHRHGRLGWALHVASDVVTETLDMTHQELRAALAEGKSLADIAGEQGVAVEDLEAALMAEAEVRIDQAVANGKMDADRAAELKTGLADRIGEMLTRVPGEGGIREKLGEHHEAIRSDLADFLGLSTDDLRAALADGQTLAEVAASQGVSEDDLVAFLLDGVEERLNQALENGRIDADALDEMLAEAESRIEDRINAEPGERFGEKGFGRYGDRGHRGWGHHGPWSTSSGAGSDDGPDVDGDA